MKKVHKERLLALADYLTLVPREKFSYASWMSSKRPNFYESKDSNPRSCGSYACALGWATTMKQFQRLGLTMLIHPTSRVRFPSLIDADPEDTERGSTRASAKIFGLTHWQHRYLFVPGYASLSCGATALRVAQHIRDFVERDGMV